MSTPKHHAEWLSLLEISGPFLSMPVLIDAFPQGLDSDDPAAAQELRAAYEEWLDNQGGLQPDPAIHNAWIRYVLQTTLGLPDEVLAEGQAIPAGLKASVPEHHETLRPDLVIHEPDSGPARMLIQIYPAEQELENAVAGLPWKASPATRMMELLHATEVRLGLVTNGEQWLLVQARRGESTGYASWYANLWVEERLTLRAFQTLLGVQRFFGVPKEETLEALLERSAQDQHEVTDQLGNQVRHAVEILIQAVDRADQDRGRELLADVGEAQLYEAALTVMMRLVFLLAAEERGLLLLGDPVYDQNYAVSTLRGQLQEMADRHGEEVLERRYDAWCRLLATFRAVYGGIQHENLRLPAYGGSLFDPDRFPFLEGRRSRQDAKTQRDEGDLSGLAPLHDPSSAHEADPLPINNRVVLYLLQALQVLQIPVPGGHKAARTLSFRALDIEQIGHVYEGLLDHQAARATELVLGLQGTKSTGDPEIPLTELEAQLEKGQKQLVNFLKDRTGRTTGALRNGLQQEPEPFRAERLRAACGNDEAIYQRVLPFAGLIRDDDYGFPVVIPAGSVYVTEGATRRQTGTHYTPRSLTEPIVQHTLEPLVYKGPAEGKPRNEWQLRAPKELLSLKVCDMAMGSGAFLVQACRYLSERLVEAWHNLQSPISDLQVTPEGTPATGDPSETIIPESDEERLTLARRLVVDRCLYGVDKNHLAVEMAKLSLWLITLDKNRSFTFLDHALRHGDSLIGADDDMFLRWAHNLRDSSMPLFDEEMRRLVNEAREKRQQLQAFEVRDIRDAQRKAQLLAEAEAATERIKLGCDLLVGARMLEELTQTERDALLANALIDFTAGKPFSDPVARRAVKVAREQPAFHWPFEFPEVFGEGGFSAFLGNPPFISGKGGDASTAAVLGPEYTVYLELAFRPGYKSADICGFFFRRAFTFLDTGTMGLIATKTISEGTTRKTSLLPISEAGGHIYRAVSKQPWPGSANVYVSVVHISRHLQGLPSVLDGESVSEIDSYLGVKLALEDPYVLASNEGKCFQGTKPRGDFCVPNDIAEKLLVQRPILAEVIRPYIRGRDIKQQLVPTGTDHIIDFANADGEKPNRYKEAYEIARQQVKPYRDGLSINRLRENWWLFEHRSDELYDAIAEHDAVICTASLSNHLVMTWSSTACVFSNQTTVFAAEHPGWFAVLHSTLHEAWCRRFSSYFKGDLRYLPNYCFSGFPMPRRNTMPECNRIGKDYFTYRQELMRECKEGLTDIYNRFHDQSETSTDISYLRGLHMKMDSIVASAYDWTDLNLGHDFHETNQGIRFTISDKARRQVLTRLLKLNHERYEEEVRQGLHEGKQKKGRKKGSRKGGKGRRKKGEGQLSLF